MHVSGRFAARKQDTLGRLRLIARRQMTVFGQARIFTEEQSRSIRGIPIGQSVAAAELHIQKS